MNHNRSFWPGVLAVSLAALSASVRADDVPALPTISRSLSLHDALAVAQANSVFVKQAQADAHAASTSARAAEAQNRPTVSATLYGSLGDSSNILTSSPGVAPQNLFNVPAQGFADQNLMAMVPLLTGGRLEGRIASARKQGEAARLSVAASRLTVTEAVTEGYASAALQQALVDVAQTRLTAEDEQVRVTQEKVNTGRSAPVDLLREQAEQADAAQGLLAAQNQSALALVRLKTALGLSQSSELTLTDTLDALTAPADLPASLAAALAQAQARRPEMTAAAARVAAAQAEVRSAKGAYSPQVYAVAMGDASAGHDLGRAGYTLGLTASLPLFDGGLRRADVDRARATVERAQADAQETQQQVEQETASAWLTAQTATASVQSAEAGVTAAQKSYDLAALRYAAGKSTTAERLDALAALTRAQGTLASTKAALVAARAQLQAATDQGDE